MRKLLGCIIAGILGIFLATTFVSGVSVKVAGEIIHFGIKISQDWQALIFIGIVLGLINFFIKPILNLITLPLRILTLGLFSFFLEMLIIWILDLIFPEFKISGIVSLFWTSFIVWFLNFLFRCK